MYITRGQLSRVVDSYQQPLNERRMFSAEHPDASVFLSHKHEEKTLLLQVKKFFENLGMSVYVDWLDTNMQHPTDKKTAEDLKKQIEKVWEGESLIPTGTISHLENKNVLAIL